MTCSHYHNPSDNNLPQLPIPTLSQTIDKYLEEAQRLTSKDQFNQTIKDAREMMENQDVKILQKLLTERAKIEENWLSDFWLRYGYLRIRDSLMITTSPGLFLGQKDEKKSHAQTIAEIFDSIIHYNETLDRKKFPTEMAGSHPLCMEQYYNIMGVYRVPLMHEDQIHKRVSKFAVIAHKNAFYRFDLYDGDDQPLSPAVLQTKIQNFLVKVSKTNSFDEPKLGLLTAWSRDEWAKCFTRLHSDPLNRKNLTTLMDCLCVFCIDSPDGEISETLRNGDLGNSVISHMLHGNGSFTANRWFDKTLQIIYKLEDGAYGMTYEHTPAEGVALARLAQMIVSPKSSPLHSSMHYSPTMGSSPKKLIWHLDAEFQEEINSASLYIKKQIENVDCRYFSFDLFGKNGIKCLKVSPDAFIQVAFQLAYFRLHKDFTATYESGSTRRFRGGRTDNIRACTDSACSFVQEADLPAVSVAVKAEMLRNAIGAHSKASQMSVAGQGTDRHLSGLKWIGWENGITVPPFFSNDAFKNYFLFRMSTSQVPLPGSGVLVFGPACLDGYGICYNPQEDEIIFAVTTFLSSGVTDIDGFQRGLIEAMKYQFCLLNGTL